MNRFIWADINPPVQEKQVLAQANVRLYDGDKKTPFDAGDLTLTTHRILWHDPQQSSREIAVHLSLVVFVEEESASWTKSAKIVAHLNAAPVNARNQGPVTFSPNNLVKFSFRSGGQPQFLRSLNDMLSKKVWEDPVAMFPEGKKYRAGIAGIERHMRARAEATGENISVAFEDLSNLMKMAKDMVVLSKSVTQKLKDKQGQISEDETIQFKSYLLSLGISDPVTKDAYSSNSSYHRELAKQLAEVLQIPLQENGGVLSLTDVYCRVNRARGLELISPEDLLNACNMFEALSVPLRLHTFDSGVRVLMLQSHDQSTEAEETTRLLEEKPLTADELSILISTTVVLARERLLAAEKLGLACRDDSVEGLRFFPNLLME